MWQCSAARSAAQCSPKHVSHADDALGIRRHELTHVLAEALQQSGYGTQVAVHASGGSQICIAAKAEARWRGG